MTEHRRFYYPASRAHHAYCMAKDFGMEFERRFGQKWEPESILHIPAASEYRIYVHADSLHLLEPQVGDILNWQTFKGEPWWEDHLRYIYPPQGTHDVFTVETASLMLRKPELSARIIQRQGLAFHWPEAEP
jgi:hypothetical protein